MLKRHPVLFALVPAAWLAAGVLFATQGQRAETISAAGQRAERLVRSAEELQAAIDAATADQTIWLAPGQLYTGHFRLPAWRGGDSRPIVIRTAGREAVPGGTRITPGTATRLAKLQSPDGAPVLSTSPGARYWRIELVEFLPNRSEENEIVALGASRANQGDRTPSDLVLDRVYIHGDPARGQRRGIALNSARTTIENSFIADIKAVGADSQAIGGWNGPGDYLIENNYLESSGENIMFGGADPGTPGLIPTSIVIRRNTLSKPVSWRQPSMRWDVKNLLELKNARHVVIEQNLFERNWAHAQSGYAILFTVRNQDGGCPWCQVEDVRFEGNVVRDVAGGISILGRDDTYPSQQTNSIQISHNLFDGIDSRQWGGEGYLLQLLRDPANIIVDHNTVIQGQSGGIAKIEGVVQGFQFTNNIAAAGSYGLIATDHAPGNDTIRATLPGAIIRSNVIAGGEEGDYPPGNLFPTLETFRQQFVDFGRRDFRLRAASQWLRASTTGDMIGALLANPAAQTSSGQGVQP